MTDLQIILLISSSVFLAGLYWWGKKSKTQGVVNSVNLRQHGFRAETPEEEGMEVRMVSGGRTSIKSADAPFVQVTAREAWDRATVQKGHGATGSPFSGNDVDKKQQDSTAIQGAMNNHSDAYLEERFALSDPVTPLHIMQPSSRGASVRPQSIHDYSSHQLEDQEKVQGSQRQESTRFYTRNDDGHLYHKDVYPQQNHHGRDISHHHDSEHYIGHTNNQSNNQDYAGHQEASLYDQHHDQYHDQYHDQHYDNYEEPIEPSLPSQIFALLVLARDSFNRREIHQTMLGAGLSFSGNGIYVFYDKTGIDSHYIFRVANVSDTGYFPDPDDQPEEFSTTGVALILELPNVVTPYRAMNEFITAARRISQNLDGHLYDASRRLIKESHLREMREYAQSIT